MKLITTYIPASIVILALGYLVLRWLYGSDYRRFGKISPLVIFCGLITFGSHAASSYLFLDSNPEHINQDSPIFFIAVICMVTGAVLLFLSMARLGFRKMFGVRFDGVQRTGLYMYTRNPQVLTYILLAIGYSLLWPSWSGLLWIILLIVICHLMVITEEEHLSRAYGDDYDRYYYATPRYIGIRKQERPPYEG
jgi:protein-S-isoprenylcysteine O-methyltransferase Ste14